MSQPPLIVGERTSRWANAWRRWGADEVRLIEVRSVAQCETALEESPAAAVALEADLAGSERILSVLSQWQVRFPRAHRIVLATSEWQACEMAFREAGAAAVVYSPRQWASAARAIRRHLAENPAEADSGDLEQQIFSRLPWARYAAANR